MGNKPADNLQIGAEGSHHVLRYLLHQRAPGPDKGQVREGQIFIATAETDLHAVPPSLRLHFQQQPRFADASLAGHEHQSGLAPHRVCKAADQPVELLSAAHKGRGDAHKAC